VATGVHYTPASIQADLSYSVGLTIPAVTSSVILSNDQSLTILTVGSTVAAVGTDHLVSVAGSTSTVTVLDDSTRIS